MINENAELWQFEAMDTLFFKESRPIESVGNNQLGSLFPPPAKTLIGAIRTAIGEHLKVDWQQFALGQCEAAIHETLGSPARLEPMRFAGPYLLQNKDRLYPVPLVVLAGKDNNTRLAPGAITDCDLGKVKLPVKQDMAIAGAKPFDQAYLKEADFIQCMQGLPIDCKNVILQKNLYSTEPRLGIARDNMRNTVEEGLLYQTQHIRPLADAGLSIGIELQGIDTARWDLPQSGLLRLGAEGRLASWTRTKSKSIPSVPNVPQANGVMLCLLSHALFAQGWLPDGFKAIETASQTVWEGTLAGKTLRIISAVIGKPVKEGGWDMVAKQPKPLTNLVPAGSCFFCTSNEPLETLQKALHGLQIGQETEWGRGLIAAGYW